MMQFMRVQMISAHYVERKSVSVADIPSLKIIECKKSILDRNDLLISCNYYVLSVKQTRLLAYVTIYSRISLTHLNIFIISISRTHTLG